MDEVETINYKGLDINIYPDMDESSPDDWGDDSIFLVAFHSDFTVERKGFDVDTCRALVDKDEIQEGMEYRTKDIKREYHIFSLEAYIHSGVVLALSQEGNFPDRQWDVSQLGLVFIAKSEEKTRAKARKRALSLIETWNDNLSGNVYGYTIEDTGDSCWGFYGNYNTNGMLDEARAEIDSHLETKRKAKQKQTRAYIENSVPLAKRT